MLFKFYIMRSFSPINAKLLTQVFYTGSKSQPNEPSSSSGARSYRFRSDVPAPPSNVAVGGKASLLPKRTPLSEEEIEAIMVCEI